MVEVEGLEMGARLGSGGFADVYEAFEPQLGRLVAVKVFRARVDGADRKSFEREARAMGQLSGVRNVVRLYRSGVTAGGNPYLVMERMEYPLSDLLGTEELTVHQVLHCGVVIGRALLEAHQAGILHRDLKPSNILIDRYGEPALSDFGISTMMHSDASSSIYAFSAEHAAPEMFEDTRASVAADEYSLAATLYTLVEGRPPFVRRADEGLLSFMTRVANELPEPCSSLIDTVPELDLLLRAALAKRPSDRPTLAQLVELLDGIARSHPSVNGQPVLPQDAPAHDAVALDEPESVEHDTILAANASRRPSEDTSVPIGFAEDEKDATRQPFGWRRTTAVGVVGLILILLAAVAVSIAMRNGGEPETAGPSNVSTTVENDGSKDVVRRPGVGNIRPLGKSGVMDSSGILRARLNEFASTTDVAVIRDAKLDRHWSGDELDFGNLPSLIDYGALNKLETSSCYRISLHDVAVIGAVRSVWTDFEQFAAISVVQLGSLLEAKQFFWATELFTGVPAKGCEGWPDNGSVVDPTSLHLERLDFDAGIEADGLLTAAQQKLDLAGFKLDFAYSAVALQNDIVLVVISGSLSGSTERPEQIATLRAMVGAFEN